MTKSEQAIRLIIQEGITAAEAADRVGISRAAVSKAKLHPSKTSQNIRKLCEMHGEIEKLTAQRDTLLAALEQIGSLMDIGSAHIIARAAISSVKGGAA